jgi:hypothetical protein
VVDERRGKQDTAVKREPFTLGGAIRGVDDETPANASDAAAIRRSFREPNAFGAVFERHFAAVHRYAQRRVGAAHADEIAAALKKALSS